MSEITVDAGSYRFPVDRALVEAAVNEIEDEPARERLAEELAGVADGGTWVLSMADADRVLDAVSRAERESEASE